ncbi:GNAT family N-acetyltransferase [Urechidicola sp. KH5]
MISAELVQTNEQIQTVVELAKQIWEQHYTAIIGEEQVAYMLDKFQSEKAISSQLKESYQYYLLNYQNTSVGYISIQERGNTLFLSKIYVLASQRGKGIGKYGIQFITLKARELDKSKISLTVNKYNTNSIKAYEKLGFKNVDAVVADIGAGYVMDDFVFNLELD